MKNSISVIFVLFAILLTSCKKEEVEVIPVNNKPNFVLLDKTVNINGVPCNQYYNSSTGQTVYKEVKGNASKAPCYDSRAFYEYVSNVGMTLVCRGFGNTCLNGTMIVGGKSVDVIIVKDDVVIK